MISLKEFIETKSKEEIRNDVRNFMKEKDFVEDVKKLLANKKFRMKVLTIVGVGTCVALAPKTTVFAMDGPEKIGLLGEKFWGYVKVIARFGCMICGGLDILRHLNQGDTKSIWKVAAKYIVAYAVIVGLPWVYNEIDLFFS